MVTQNNEPNGPIFLEYSFSALRHGEVTGGVAWRWPREGLDDTKNLKLIDLTQFSMVCLNLARTCSPLESRGTTSISMSTRIRTPQPARYEIRKLNWKRFTIVPDNPSNWEPSIVNLDHNISHKQIRMHKTIRRRSAKSEIAFVDTRKLLAFSDPLHFEYPYMNIRSHCQPYEVNQQPQGYDALWTQSNVHSTWTWLRKFRHVSSKLLQDSSADLPNVLQAYTFEPNIDGSTYYQR